MCPLCPYRVEVVSRIYLRYVPGYEPSKRFLGSSVLKYFRAARMLGDKSTFWTLFVIVFVSDPLRSHSLSRVRELTLFKLYARQLDALLHKSPTLKIRIEVETYRQHRHNAPRRSSRRLQRTLVSRNHI